MHVKSFVFNPFYENTYLIWDDTGEALVVDPGCYEKYEQEELQQGIEELGLNIVGVINTHCHIDHVLGNYFAKTTYKCPLWVPRNEVDNYRGVEVYAPQWGIQRFTWVEADQLIDFEGKMTFGHTELEIIYVPGHSPGHVVFYHAPEQKLIGGDVLFRESIGRTDLPGGNHEELLKNIKEKLYTLPGETEVFPGHGPTTTIGYEKTHNPFVRAS